MAMEKSRQSKYIDTTFPDEATKLILEIITKYGLERFPKEVIKKLSELKTFKEREEIIENLPQRKLAKLIKEAATKGLSPKDLSLRLRQELGLAEKEASDMADDLKKKVLFLARKTFIEEEIVSTDLIEKSRLENKTSTPMGMEILEPKKGEPSKPPQKPDAYHESLE